MSAGRALDGIFAGDFNDPTNERLIYLSAAGLALLGLGLLFGTLIWWRRGRQEHPALAPLEVMSTRSWENSPEGERRRKLEQVRLSGAAGSVEEPIVAPPVDLEALVRSVPEDFDDLREPSAVIAVPAAAVVASEVVADEPEEPVADVAEEAVEVEADDEAEVEADDEAEVEADVEAEVDAGRSRTRRGRTVRSPSRRRSMSTRRRSRRSVRSCRRSRPRRCRQTPASSHPSHDQFRARGAY